MATEERALGNLEGRMAEQSALLHQINADLSSRLQQVNADLTSGLQQVNADLTSGLQQVNADLTSGLQHVNARIDRLMLAMLAIGGGLAVALFGVTASLVTLLVRGG